MRVAASALLSLALLPCLANAEVSPEQACIYFIGLERIAPELRDADSQPRVVVPFQSPSEGTAIEFKELALQRYQAFTWELQAGIFRPVDLIVSPDPIDQVGVMISQLECLVDVVDRRVVRILVEPAPPSTNKISLPNGAQVEPRYPVSQAIEVGNRGHRGAY